MRCCHNCETYTVDNLFWKLLTSLRNAVLVGSKCRFHLHWHMQQEAQATCQNCVPNAIGSMSSSRRRPSFLEELVWVGLLQGNVRGSGILEATFVDLKPRAELGIKAVQLAPSSNIRISRSKPMGLLMDESVSGRSDRRPGSARLRACLQKAIRIWSLCVRVTWNFDRAVREKWSRQGAYAVSIYHASIQDYLA